MTARGAVPTVHAERLVRPLIVEAVDEVIELGLLPQEVGAGRFGGLQLQRQMHAFMAAVLLRVARFDTLDGDAEPEPPDRQPGKIEESIGACEGHTVIRSDRPGQAELLESVLEHGEGIGLLGRVERLAGQEIATGEIADRQRIAIAPIGKHELALVVGTPQIVGPAGMGERRSLRSVASSLAALDQAVAVQNCMHR